MFQKLKLIVKGEVTKSLFLFFERINDEDVFMHFSRSNFVEKQNF